jgi:hypothetical protein
MLPEHIRVHRPQFGFLVSSLTISNTNWSNVLEADHTSINGAELVTYTKLRMWFSTKWRKGVEVSHIPIRDLSPESLGFDPTMFSKVSFLGRIGIHLRIGVEIVSTQVFWGESQVGVEVNHQISILGI